ALGSSEVSLLQLTNAYRALANSGRVSAVASPLLRTKPQAPKWTRVIDLDAAFVVGDILSDPNARARTFGLDSVLATRFWSAVKTGTSKDMRDNWAIGWSERYTVGVWVGNAAGGAMHDVSGSSGAAPMWASVMGYLHANEASRAPHAPKGVVQTAVRFGLEPASGNPLEAPRSEWFLKGTEQALFAIDREAVSAYASSDSGNNQHRNQRSVQAPALRIAEPASGAVVALDPDIPPANQRLRFMAAGVAPGAQLRWWLDGKLVGRGAAHAWLPWPGRHQLQLQDASGRVLDDVRFEVRGAGVSTVFKAPAVPRVR
ncbi:MAG: penicillin-binding protein 1C, partial [Giesbergeria sp.]